MRKQLLYFALLVVCSGVRAQDFHFSQYDVAHIQLNSATTGAELDGDFTLTLDQRSQWRSLNIKPFMSSYLGFETSYLKGHHLFGVGGFVLNNSGGLGGFNTLTFMCSISHELLAKKVSVARAKIGRRSVSAAQISMSRLKHSLRIGLQIGFFNRTINTDKLVYDAQYNPGSAELFDRGLPSNENVLRQSMFRLDANYGLLYRFVDKRKKCHPFAGMALSHLTMPNESFTDTRSRMPLKLLLHGGAAVRVNTRLQLTPRFYYSRQAKAGEISAGLIAEIFPADPDICVLGGFDYRVKDAAILTAGLNYKSYSLRLSYDINTSYLRRYTNGRGAFEITLSYTGNKVSAATAYQR